jgi:predicted CoA-substrate-specific enzyme activase
MAFFGGIDLGSTTTKLVVIDESRRVVYRDLIPTAGNIPQATRASLARCLEGLAVGPEALEVMIATGYGRKKVEFADHDVTEITCHGIGAYHLFPEARTVVDIGGQDSKAIQVGEDGAVADFAMNDKCAAGTGRYLEMLARTFRVELDQLGDLALASTQEIRISSICTVFAESEVISLVAEGIPVADILGAAHRAVSEKVVGLAKRVGVRPRVVFTGGVSRNAGIRKALGAMLGEEIAVPPDADLVGALGAALWGLANA